MNKKIVVFGSYVTDLTVFAPQLPIPGQTILGKYFKSGPGGKGSNQAVAIHRTGTNVTFITKLGKDALGDMARVFYENEKMSLEGILCDDVYETGAALIIVDEQSAQNEIVVTLGACGHFTEQDVEFAKQIVSDADILLVQLETNLEATEEIVRFAKEKGVLTILNPAPAKPLKREFLKNIDILTPNETEASSLTGIYVDKSDNESIRRAARALIDQGVRKVIITLGEKGAYASDGNEELFYEPIKTGEVVDTTGAGDAFNGGFAAGIAQGLEFFQAIKYATVVSSLAVTRVGTAPAMPHKSEIVKYLQD